MDELTLGGIILLVALWAFAGAGVAVNSLTGWLNTAPGFWPFDHIGAALQRLYWRVRKVLHSGRGRRFVYGVCPECEFDVVAIERPASILCPLCMSDNRHQVKLKLRPARDDDKPEGVDMRLLSAVDLDMIDANLPMKGPPA